MNLITVENRPPEPVHVPWISLNPHREWVNFAHSLHYGTTKAISLEQNSACLIQTGPQPDFVLGAIDLRVQGFRPAHSE